MDVSETEYMKKEDQVADGTIPGESQEVPPEIRPFLSNPYVAYYKNGKLFYKPGFHKALCDKLNEGLNPKEAYDALGFDTKVLGYDRAYGAAKRARQKEANNTLMAPEVEEEVLDSEEIPKGPSQSEPVPEWLDELKNNRYVKSYSKGRLHYTDEFYEDILKLVEKGMTAGDAYKALGFPVDKLGPDRAAQAVQYAKTKAQNRGTLNYEVNGTIPFDEVMRKNGIIQFDPYDPKQASMAFDRLVFLETMFKELKKKTVDLGGNEYDFLFPDVPIDCLKLLNGFLDCDWYKGITIKRALDIFYVSPSTYYSALQRAKEEEKKREQREKKKEEEKKKEHRTMRAIKAVIEMLGGWVPGARKMRIYLQFYHHIKIGRKECSRIMKKMKVIPEKTRTKDLKLDPYKGQATHIHPGLALENLVGSDFFQAPRQVVLTDITYVPFQNGKKTAYHCVFFDPFVNQELGEYTSLKMDTSLVKNAYLDMMRKHGAELKNGYPVLIHSDQGSQYTATTIKELIENDGFLQSMSKRATPTDNAPMEAGFGRMKEWIGDLLYNARDFETVQKTLSGFWKNHNEKTLYECLAYLSPNDFYNYWKTGIFPLDNYFGVDKAHFYTPDQIIQFRKDKAEDTRKKSKKKYAKYKKHLSTIAQQLKDATNSPLGKVMKDKKLAEDHKKDAVEVKDDLDKRVNKLESLLKKIDQAILFITQANEQVLEDLKSLSNWSKYPELAYIYDMGACGIM